ncbi:MAG: hypothetical protein QOI25_3913, partial [Mycobacterium sp.]|nr:hypothetical protein [Mycobacterium sp.]
HGTDLASRPAAKGSPYFNGQNGGASGTGAIAGADGANGSAGDGGDGGNGGNATSSAGYPTAAAVGRVAKGQELAAESAGRKGHRFGLLEWPSATSAIGPAAASCAKAGTDGFVESGPGRLQAHITDRSGVSSQCTYATDNFNRGFGLPANSTYDLRIVPSVPQFRNWNVTITCDNGTTTQASTYF